MSNLHEFPTRSKHDVPITDAAKPNGVTPAQWAQVQDLARATVAGIQTAYEDQRTYREREALKAAGDRLTSSPNVNEQITGVLAVAIGHWSRAAESAMGRGWAPLTFPEYLASYLGLVRSGEASGIAARLKCEGLDRLLRVVSGPEHNQLDGTYQRRSAPKPQNPVGASRKGVRLAYA